MRLKTESDFENLLGKKIKIKGQVSTVIWQHMIVLQTDYPEISYFSLVDGLGEEHHQFVVYSKEPLPKSGIITLEGRIIKSEGETKHPGKEQRKYYYEYQFIAEKIIN